MSRSEGDGSDAAQEPIEGKTRNEFDEAVAELQRTGRALRGGVARRVGRLGAAADPADSIGRSRSAMARTGVMSRARYDGR